MMFLWILHNRVILDGGAQHSILRKASVKGEIYQAGALPERSIVPLHRTAKNRTPLLMSARVRVLWWRCAGRRGFDQQLLKEEMLEYFPLNHLLNLPGGVATAEIQAAANDLDAGRQVGVLHREPNGEKRKPCAQLRNRQARLVWIPLYVCPWQQYPVFLRHALPGKGHPKLLPSYRLLCFGTVAAQQAIKRLHERGKGKVHQNNPGTGCRPGQPWHKHRPEDSIPVTASNIGSGSR